MNVNCVNCKTCHDLVDDGLTAIRKSGKKFKNG